MKDAFCAMVTALLVLYSTSAIACAWDGAKIALVPGVVVIERGCCDNEGNLRVLVFSQVLLWNRWAIYAASALGIAAIAFFFRWVAQCFCGKDSCQQAAPGDAAGPRP